MSGCSDRLLHLHGWLDGELDAAHALAMEEHLKACEPCSAELARLRTLRDALSAPGIAYKAPEVLRARVAAALDLAAVPPPSRSRRPRMLWAATGAGAAAAALTLVIAAPAFQSGGVEDQLVASHVRSLLASHLTDVVTSNEHVVRPWFNGKIDFSPPVPELSAQGFPLLGGRLDYIDGRVVPAIVYRRRLHTLNLFVWPDDRFSLLKSRTTRREGINVVEWSQGGLRFAAVSDIGVGELEQFRAAFQQHAA